MEVDYKIICTPVAIRYICPHCQRNVESEWTVKKAMAGVSVCPKCNKAVRLGKGEVM